MNTGKTTLTCWPELSFRYALRLIVVGYTNQSVAWGMSGQYSGWLFWSLIIRLLSPPASWMVTYAGSSSRFSLSGLRIYFFATAPPLRNRLAIWLKLMVVSPV